MEEKVVGGKEKKYVLYTVVGEERGRAGVGVWVVRVLLGTLLLVALAVVPYLSLRLAQVSDHTLVVFQSVPDRNHALHHRGGEFHAGKSNHVEVERVPQSASLTKENATEKTVNATTKASATNSSSTNSSGSGGGGIVTLHESAVTLAVMEDTNATRKRGNESDVEETVVEEDVGQKAGVEEEKKEPEENATTEDSASTSEAPASVAQVAAVTDQASPSTPPAVVENNTSVVNTSPPPHHESNASSAAPVASTVAVVASTTPASTPQTPPSTTGKAATPSASNVSTTPSTTTPKTTTSPTTTSSTSSRRPLAHKLVYMSTSASGNHVGGFCVWKTDKNVTRWSYFYENIPIEYQSHQDSSDHEMRGMLAAVRTWAPLWNDHHVVLRSHHPAINGADHPTRRALTRELERLSNGRFTYELEWRLKKTDRVVDIAYCLSRLHRDFAHWFRTFEGRVDELLGRQVWATARIKNRTPIVQDAFLTDDPDDEEVRGDK
ncbi:location of vulva defective 1-like [Penaeus japonicus]|uniref:location of vulva defective 1-like n=1 Tax=Penaeus japonicus TaxID=27405 RepID=UPI001C715530|nr:location of vulva defective 1-like [Penaeus japonicus]